MPTGRGTRKTVKSAFELEALGAPIEVRRHPAARRLTLRVSKTKRAVIVTVPAECRHGRGRQVSQRAISTGCASASAACPSRCRSPTARRIPLRGRLHRVCFTGPERGRAVVEIEQSGSGMPRLDVAGRLEHAPRRLKDWLVEQARGGSRCLRRTSHPQASTSRRAASRLRDQTSRWGSCTAGGLLSFSWRLILAPGARARLRRRARGCPPARDEPRSPVLEARGALRAAPGGGQALAAQPRRRSAPLRRNALSLASLGSQPQFACGAQ